MKQEERIKFDEDSWTTNRKTKIEIEFYGVAEESEDFMEGAVACLEYAGLYEGIFTE